MKHQRASRQQGRTSEHKASQGSRGEHQGRTPIVIGAEERKQSEPI